MKLKIAARTFSVVPMSQAEYESGENIGYTQANSGIIAIYPGVPADHQAETLIHEAIHAAWYAYGLPPKATEEQVAQHIGAALAQIIRDNPTFIGKIVGAHQGDPVVKGDK